MPPQAFTYLYVWLAAMMTCCLGQQLDNCSGAAVAKCMNGLHEQRHPIDCQKALRHHSCESAGMFHQDFIFAARMIQANLPSTALALDMRKV